jgi:putative resolvase
MIEGLWCRRDVCRTSYVPLPLDSSWADSRGQPVRSCYATNKCIVEEIKTAAHALRLYARISSAEQRKDLEAQLRRLVVYAYSRLTIVQAVPRGVAARMAPPQLIKLLANPKIQAIVVEHRDRLMRFSAEYIEATLTHGGASS